MRELPKPKLITLVSLTMGGITIVLLLATAGVLRTGTRFLSDITGIFTPGISPPQVNVPTLVIEQIREASELTTAVFVMEAVVPTSQDRTLGDFVLGTTQLLYVAHGEVRAGVDLSKLQTHDIQVNSDRIQILLPPPQILDSKIDVTRSSVYHYDRGFLGLGPDVAPQLQTLAQRETLEKITATACEKGLLEEANQKAELAVTQLLTTAGYSEVTVQTRPPTSGACLP